MSNNNQHWGRRFGSVDIDKDGVVRERRFPVKQMGTGKEGQGPHQTPLVKGSAKWLQSESDRELHRQSGRPALYFRGGRKHGSAEA